MFPSVPLTAAQAVRLFRSICTRTKTLHESVVLRDTAFRKGRSDLQTPASRSGRKKSAPHSFETNERVRRQIRLFRRPHLLHRRCCGYSQSPHEAVGHEVCCRFISTGEPRPHRRRTRHNIPRWKAKNGSGPYASPIRPDRSTRSFSACISTAWRDTKKILRFRFRKYIPLRDSTRCIACRLASCDLRVSGNAVDRRICRSIGQGPSCIIFHRRPLCPPAHRLPQVG